MCSRHVKKERIAPLLIWAIRDCLGFTPRSNSFDYKTFGFSNLNILAIRTNSLCSCRPYVNPFEQLTKLRFVCSRHVKKERIAPLLIWAIRDSNT